MDPLYLKAISVYSSVIGWLQAHTKPGFWLVMGVSVFVLLTLAYLLLCNIRLHIFIRRLNRDKQRLMEEKDLMRKGIETDSGRHPKVVE